MNNKKSTSGFYIALCSCVMIIALVGYAGRLSTEPKSSDENPTPQEVISIEEDVISDKDEVSEITVPAEEIIQTPEPTAKPVVKQEIIEEDADKEFLITLPTAGKILENFSGENLVYFPSVSEWRVHGGVDISAAEGEDVLCVYDGVVERVFTSVLGESVLVNHNNGYKTLYANLSEQHFVAVGNKVKKGATIGRASNTAVGDLSDEAHIHFEVLYDSVQVDPLEFIE